MHMIASHARTKTPSGSENRSKSSAACLAFGLVGLAIVVVGTGSVGCSSDAEEDQTASADGTTDPEPLFRAVEADLVTTCGGANGSCHVRGNSAPHWLADPDPYLSAKKYRGILPATREVGDSILLTQIDHAGPSLKRTPALYEGVAAWLQAELPPPPLPNTGAFSVATGFNSINLNTVASGLEGAKLTFLATDENGVLTLTALRLQAPPKANVELESPFFVLLPRNGKVNADPEVNGFKGQLTIPAGSSAELFGGKMILLRWDPAGQLKIVFQKIETSPGEGLANGCTALDVFQSQALPAMRSQVDEIAVYEGDGGVPDDAPPAGTVLGKNSCIGCHGKAPTGNDAPSGAVQAMDLRDVDTDVAKACAQARNWINFDDRTQSTLLLNPTGKANPNHPIKPLADGDPIIKGLAAWIQAEQR
jgi:mono/diheme cytochrome c family protein